MVRFDQEDPKKARSVSLEGIKLIDADLENVTALSSLDTLILKRSSFPTTALRHISNLSQLTWLDLMDTALTDDGLKPVEGLSGLKELVLGLNPAVTDAGLRHVTKLPIWKA